MMRKHMLKKSAMLIISLVLAFCFLTAAAACGGDKKKDPPDNSVKEEAGQVEIVKKDWKGTEGFWEITDNVFYQKQDKAAGRLVYQKQVDQDYITFKAQVKLMTADASAGIEFRSQKEVETSDASLTTFSLSVADGAVMKFPSGSDRYGKGQKKYKSRDRKMVLAGNHFKRNRRFVLRRQHVGRTAHRLCDQKRQQIFCFARPGCRYAH